MEQLQLLVGSHMFMSRVSRISLAFAGFGLLSIGLLIVRGPTSDNPSLTAVEALVLSCASAISSACGTVAALAQNEARPRRRVILGFVTLMMCALYFVLVSLFAVWLGSGEQ